MKNYFRNRRKFLENIKSQQSIPIIVKHQQTGKTLILDVVPGKELTKRIAAAKAVMLKLVKQDQFPEGVWIVKRNEAEFIGSFFVGKNQRE